MKFVNTSNLKASVLHEFFEEKWETFDNQQSLREYGYLVEHKGVYQAYFALAPVEEQAFWLKSLYIKEGVPSSFPLAIIEASITLAKDNLGSYLYINSHQDALSSLLSLMNFEKKQEPFFAEGLECKDGTWWKMDVTSIAQTN
ncbi:hypothetical protein [Aquibacillus rhizosphaerae]|uniref:GNAT family N-acetyltransferase n=1 Tax=Aquibacillus rhizosphaerae TaxID=3051431 RepID=A0ABT7L089_9BACI|nr:hypothetical protein [Aquibacillus sp. LR5S19]MDL4839162.1 hypothetical protein [Aquibacillus sp. LR5S19]